MACFRALTSRIASSTLRVAGANLSHSVLIRNRDTVDGLKAVCAGRVDATVMADNVADGALIAAATDCRDLSFLRIPGLLTLGVGATYKNAGAVAAAEAIRTAI